MREIYKTNDSQFRIIETEDAHADLDDLKGDTYNSLVNTDIVPEKLRQQEKEFERLVEREGVFGYVLEKWNPAAGQGYEHVDSCFGFVGRFSTGEAIFDHYIVEDMKEKIKSMQEL